jgi:hypothetical protein
MLRAVPGVRLMRPTRSRLRTIWWTLGGTYLAWRAISIAGSLKWYDRRDGLFWLPFASQVIRNPKTGKHP